MIQSIVHRWPFLSPIFRVAYESRVEKTGHLLKLSTNRSNFLLLHKIGSAGQPGCVPLIETSDGKSEGATSGEYGGWGRTSHFNVAKYVLTTFATWGCYAAKSLYRVSRCIAAVCLSMLGSNASIAFDIDRL